MATKLSECVEAGYNAHDVLAECETRDWKGLELEWIANSKLKKNAQQPRTAEHLQNGFHQIDQMNWE